MIASCAISLSSLPEISSTHTGDSSARSRRSEAESVEAGHPHVEQRHIGRQRLDHRRRPLPVRRLADEVEPVVLADQPRQRAAHRGMVIGDQDLDGLRRRGHGRI